MQNSTDTGKWRRSGTHGDVTPELYEGVLCAVKRCKHSEQAVRELEIALALQGHKNIIQVLGSSVEADQVVTYMECVPTTLLELLSSKPGGSFDVKTAHRFFMQMLDGLQFIHNKGYVHKDFKLENILVLFDTDSSEEILRLIDFGFSLPYTKGKASMVDNKGSYHYAAPEIWHGIPHEGPNVDIWALGVVLYLLVTGYFPFGGRTPDEIYEEIERHEIWFPAALQSTENKPLRKLIKGLLAYDMRDRLSLDQILVHPWVCCTTTTSSSSSSSLSSSLLLSPSSSSSSSPPTTSPFSQSPTLLQLDLVAQADLSEKLDTGRPLTAKTPRGKSPRGEIPLTARKHSQPSSSPKKTTPAEVKTTKSAKKAFLKRLGKMFR